MAKQLVNVGTSVNKGDGDPLRTAFQKINDNFNELYASTSLDLDSIGSNMIPTSDGGFALGSATKQWSDLYVRDFIYIGGTRLQSDAQGNITVDGGSLQIKDVQGDIFADDSTKVFDSSTQTFTGKFEGELIGTVAADDSTVLIDGVAGTINAGALTGALPAIDGSALTGVSASSIAFSNITSKPTTISGYGITDAYTQTQVDTAITNATSSLVIPAGSSQSIDVVAADSTLLVDSSNGTLNSSALTKPIKLDDDEKAIFGTGDDFQIWHNGSSSIIQNATGELQLRGNTVRLLNAATTKDYAYFNNNGSVDLYYDGVKKFETSTDGIAVTGRITGLTNPTAAQDAATKAYVDATSGGGGGGSAFTNIGIGADDSTIRTISEGESFLILGGTGITTASNAEGNITITGFDGAFGSLSGTPTTISGYGITDALTAGGALTGNSLEAVAVGAGVADGNDLSITGGDATEVNSIGGDANITGGSGALQPGNVNIGTTQTTLVTIGSGSNNVDFPSGTTVDFSGATITGTSFLTSYTETDPVVGAITGLVKSDGSGNISAAVAGTDYLTTVAFADLTGKPTTLGGYGITDAATTGTETTFTKDVHFDRGVEEKFQTLTGQSGVVAHNWNDGHVFYHTTPAGDITANFINVNLTAEYATNVTIIINQGATPYIITAVQIAGSGQTINWQGGSAPTGTANGIDSFSFTILNDGGSYVVLGQMVDFT